MTKDFSALERELLGREKRFAAFASGPLLEFWQQRQESSFEGVGGIEITYVRFVSPDHQRAIVISPGRTEGYIKYQELAYDLFRCGYDIWIIDHRGQGFSGRMLEDGQRGHVERFDDYVEDFESFWQVAFTPQRYRRTFLLAHSMGGAISALFLTRHPDAVAAAVFCSPMLGIRLPMPKWLAKRITSVAERWRRIREHYAVGTGRWISLPYAVNILTHSRVRYRLYSYHYSDYPELRIGGPTYRWVKESIYAGEQAIAQAAKITTPLMLLQAGEERIVNNDAQDAFCQAMAQAGHPCESGGPIVIKGAFHEILFERDALRTAALLDILRFFEQY